MPRARPTDHPVRIPKTIKISLQRPQRHQSLDKHLIQLNKEPIFRHRKNDPLEVFADPVGHKLHLLPLDQLTLGICCPPLRLRALHRHIRKLFGRDWFCREPVLCFVPPHFRRTIVFNTIFRQLLTPSNPPLTPFRLRRNLP